MSYKLRMEIKNKYKLTVKELNQTKNGNRSWIGTVYDYSSKKETTIGRILIPSIRGRLSGYSLTFLEYANYDEYAPIDIPHTRALFSNHHSYHPELVDIPRRLRVHYGHGSKPNPNSNIIFSGNSTYIIETGNEVVRKTPEDQDFFL